MFHRRRSVLQASHLEGRKHQRGLPAARQAPRLHPHVRLLRGPGGQRARSSAQRAPRSPGRRGRLDTALGSRALRLGLRGPAQSVVLVADAAPEGYPPAVDRVLQLNRATNEVALKHRLHDTIDVLDAPQHRVGVLEDTSQASLESLELVVRRRLVALPPPVQLLNLRARLGGQGVCAGSGLRDARVEPSDALLRLCHELLHLIPQMR
mmetsp:Transcript_11666/g.31852  ORF Transcript_11666/g.31852 Transcript_11666/m.31852 type:complete len:208 (-) Transcript_11666:962-1585(-)